MKSSIIVKGLMHYLIMLSGECLGLRVLGYVTSGRTLGQGRLSLLKSKRWWELLLRVHS